MALVFEGCNKRQRGRQAGRNSIILEIGGLGQFLPS